MVVSSNALYDFNINVIKNEICFQIIGSGEEAKRFVFYGSKPHYINGRSGSAFKDSYVAFDPFPSTKQGMHKFSFIDRDTPESQFIRAYDIGESPEHAVKECKEEAGCGVPKSIEDMPQNWRKQTQCYH